MNEHLIQLLRASNWTFVGRLGADPEVRYFQSGAAVANVNIAINQPDAKKDDGKPADWVRLEVWGQEEAQAFADAMHKGSLVKASGRVRSNSYTNRNGEAQHQWVCRVDQWSTVGGGNTAASAPAAAAPSPTARPAAAPTATVWQTNPASDEVPF